MTHSSSNNNKVREEALPSGCAPDAIKLFVGNIPRNYNETQLLPLFEAFGPVIDLGIVRDKATLVSKGSAFLWFRERVHAEQAMAQLNLRCVLPDRDPGCPRGGRPLEVRRARPRQQPQQPSVKDAGPRQPSSPSHLGLAGSIHGKAAGQARLEPSRGLKWEVLMPNSQESNSDVGSAASWHHSTRHSDPGPCGFPSGDLDADCISEQLPTLSLSDSFAMSPPSGDIIADVVRMMVPPVQSQYPRSQLLTSLGKALRDAKRDAQQSAWLHDVVSVGDGPVPGQFGPGPAMPPMRPPLGVGGPVMTPDEGLVVESYAVDHSAPLFPVAVANLHSMQTLSGAAVVMSPGANSTSVLFNVMGTREQVQAALWMLVVLLNVKSGTGNEDGNVVKVPV